MSRKVNQGKLIILCLIILGIGLRLWHIKTDLLFHRDQGLHSLAIWNIWHEKRFSLLGPPSDVDGLYHAPIYYWLMTPAYTLSGGDPAFASAFQIVFEALSLPFLFIAINHFFSRSTAYITLLFYIFSYGFISYSRWLVNVTPIFPLVNFLLYFLSQKNKYNFHPFLTSFIIGAATQMDAAVGIFLYPFLFWFYRPLSLKKTILLLLGFFLPASPLLIFELRHSFVITNALFRFSGSGNQGLGFSFSIIFRNLKTLLTQINYLLSFPYLLPSTLLFLWGLFTMRQLKQAKFIYLYLLFFFLSLSIFQRGAHGFFLVPLFPVVLAITAHGLLQLPKVIVYPLILLFLLLNLSQLKNIYQPNNALIPIGDANIITLQDRKNILDWIYAQAQGQPFSYWTYTLPYYQEYAWDYLLVWYALPKYGYLPEKTGSFSPNDLKTSKYFFAIYEEDHDQPQRQQGWFNEIESNFGPVKNSYQSHSLIVELRSWRPTKLQ